MLLDVARRQVGDEEFILANADVIFLQPNRMAMTLQYMH